VSRLNADGSRDSGFASTFINGVGSGWVSFPVLTLSGVSAQIEVDGPPKCPILGVSGLTNGQVYVFGSFKSFQGRNVPGLVRLRADGLVDTSFAIGGGPGFLNKPQLTPSILAIAATPAGELWIAGRFDLFNGTPARGLVLVSQDGSVSPFSPTDIVYDFESLATYVPLIVPNGNSLVFLGGEFRRNGDVWPTAINYLGRVPIPPVSLRIAQVEGGVQLVWPGAAGLQYQFSISTNLKAWTDLGQPIPGAAGLLTNEVPVGPDASVFFRMRQF